jgi:hypothetical protein
MKLSLSRRYFSDATHSFVRASHATGSVGSARRLEEQLLLWGASVHCGRDDPILSVEHHIDIVEWTWVLDQAHHHAIEPLVQSLLGRANWQSVPAAVQSHLDQCARGIAMRSMQQARELVRVATRIEANGIQVIPLKGPVMGQLAYGNLAFRHALDVDLLVRQEDFDAALKTLYELGYEPLRSLSESEAEGFIDWHASYELVHPDQRIIVELHADFFPGIHAAVVPLDAVWRRQIEVPFAGADLRSLALEDLLIYLCAHGTKHRWTKLKWLADIAGIIHRHPDVDWDAVQVRARAMGSLRMVKLGLWLAHTLLQAPFPKAFRDGREENIPEKKTPLRDPNRADSMRGDVTIQAMAATVETKWLFAAPDDPVDLWREFWFHLRERERWRDRIPYVMHSLQLILKPSERDHAVLRLPKYLSWLYVAIRPLRIVWDALVAARRRDGN